MTIQDWVSTLIGIAGFLSGLVLWYRGAVEKQYASQRDFAHLRRNQEQLLQNLGSLSEDIDEGKRAALEAAHRVDLLVQQVDAMSRVLIEQKSLVTILTQLVRPDDVR